MTAGITHLRYFCSPYHSQSALYPVIDQLLRAADIGRSDPPENCLRRTAKLRYF